MSNQTSIEKLIHTGKKVFTAEDLSVIWEISNRRTLIERIKYYLRGERLVSIHRGVYALGEYTALDVAQKLVPLSYLSLYITGQMHGLTFQHYSSIFCIALKSKKYTVNGQQYVYHEVKETIFYNELGLVNQGRYIIANKERTICDLLYVFPDAAFDNLAGIDVDMLQQISHIYGNKRLEKAVSDIIANLKEDK